MGYYNTRAESKDYDITITDPALTEHGFTKFSLPLNGNGTTSVMVVHNTDKSKMMYPNFYKSDLDKTVQSFEEKILSDGILIDDDTADNLVRYFRNECVLLSEDEDSEFFKNGNGKSNKSKSEKTKKEIFAQRYTTIDGSIAEAVIVGGRPKFAIAVPKVENPSEISITLQDAIEIGDDMIIKPFESTSYMSRPYSFNSVEGFQELVENIRTKDLDALYKKVKSIWRKYIDADDFHISLCAADTIFTYFQDKIGLTHYLFFVGGNDSGKSNNLTVLHYLAYRNMMDSGMTAPNMYTFLGSGEEGIGTVCEDEADNIDQDNDKMKVYKNGYTTGKHYHKLDTSGGGRVQQRFNTFSFKACAAEKLPDPVIAKGFRERTIELPCVYGFPQYDILEVENAAGDEEYEQLLEELHTMRNSLLIYRLLHFNEKIPNLKLNIRNREKQLFKPVIRVFQSQASQSLSELLPVISKYVSQKRESKADTLHAFLYNLTKDLINAQNTYELGSNLIWNTIKETLQGKDISYKPQSYDTVEFGIISQRGKFESLVQVFGAKRSRDTTSRKLVFDPSKLERLSKIYDLSVEVQVMTHEEDNDDMTLMTHMTLAGLDRHLGERSSNQKMEDIDQENQNLHDKTSQNVENITAQQDDEAAQPLQEVSQVSWEAPPKQKQEDCSYFCKYCEYDTGSQDDYERHIVLKHPGKPGYPNSAELQKLGLEAQGKGWET